MPRDTCLICQLGHLVLALPCTPRATCLACGLEVALHCQLKAAAQQHCKVCLQAGNGIELGSDESEDDGNLDMCVLCGIGGSLVCCDGCPGAFHMRCIGETAKSMPDGEWLCAECCMGGRGEQCCEATAAANATSPPAHGCSSHMVCMQFSFLSQKLNQGSLRPPGRCMSCHCFSRQLKCAQSLPCRRGGGAACAPCGSVREAEPLLGPAWQALHLGPRGVQGAGLRGCGGQRACPHALVSTMLLAKHHAVHLLKASYEPAAEHVARKGGCVAAGLAICMLARATILSLLGQAHVSGCCWLRVPNSSGC